MKKLMIVIFCFVALKAAAYGNVRHCNNEKWVFSTGIVSYSGVTANYWPVDSVVVHLPGIAAMKAYTGTATTIIVDTLWTGGIFNLKGGTVTIDNGINFSSLVGGHWERQVTAGADYMLTWWGVKPDSSMDNTAQIQTAINYMASIGGGVIRMIPGNYRATNDTIKSQVFLRGYFTRGMSANKLSPTTEDTTNVVKWNAQTSGVIINTPPAIPGGTVGGATCTMAGLQGISFYGLGKSTAVVGVNLISTKNFKIEDCNFRNMSGSAVVEGPVPANSQSQTLYMNNCFIVNCLQNMSPYTNYQGALEIEGTDNKITNCEVSGSNGPGYGISSNGYRAAIAVKGSDNFFENDNAEFGDVNWYLGPSFKGYRGMMVNCKSDSPQKEALLVDGAQDWQITNFLVKSSGLLAANTYSAIKVKNGAANINITAMAVNQISGSSAKYLLSDSTNITNGITQKNQYHITGDSTTYATAKFNILNASNLGGSLVEANNNAAIDNAATPNVNGKGFIIGSAGTTITNFNGGQTSQEISLFLTASTTITHNPSAIFLNSQASTTFPPKTLLKFINVEGVWYQEGADTAPAGLFLAGTSALGVAASTTTYTWPNGGAGSYSTEASRTIVMPAAGLLRNLYVKTVGAQSSTGSLVVTVRKNTADQALSITVPAGASGAVFSDLTDRVSVAAGDSISIELINSATVTSSGIVSISMTFTQL